MDNISSLDDPLALDHVSALDAPLPWEQISSKESVFAWLIPLNALARRAFDQVVESMITNPSTHSHQCKFIHVFGKSVPRPTSVSGSTDADQSQYVGAFKFSTSMLPKEPTMGWTIGTGYRKPEVDVVIGPSDPKWNHNDILGKHARLYIHKESCRTTVQAFHRMVVSGSTGIKYLGPNYSNSIKVLEHGHMILFGECTYIFRQGPAIENGNFQKSLNRLMSLQYSHQWQAHPIFSAPSTAAYLTLDDYTFISGAFAGGTFGEVSAGWAQDGSAVAIKRFKQPDEFRLSQHVDMMNLIGEHPNVLKLLQVSHNPQLLYPAAYCVYSPLALASLEDIQGSFHLNIPAQIALFIDYLRGLVHLHETKGIMHRNIKPSNLGVLSCSPFKGVLLDLDAATTEAWSDDHNQGTIAYLAPEVIALKLSSMERKKYGRQVDIWALGMSAFFALKAAHVQWNTFDHGYGKGCSLPNTTITDFVSGNKLANFHHWLGGRAAQRPEISQYLSLIKRMTAYRPVDRPSASEALGIAQKLIIPWGAQRMDLRPNPLAIKPKFGEV